MLAMNPNSVSKQHHMHHVPVKLFHSVDEVQLQNWEQFIIGGERLCNLPKMRYPFSRCSKLKLVHFEFDKRFSWFFAWGFFKSTKPAQMPVKEASSFWSENDWNPSIAKLIDSGSFRARRSQFCKIFVSISSSGNSQISWLARFIAFQWSK